VDKGTKPLPFCPGEVITEGLDGLGERLDEYYKLGARFAKWRAVIDIAAGTTADSFLHLHPHQCPCAGAICRHFARSTTSCRSSSRKC
jgi:fructose-bisphosphate aldolase class I